MATILVVDDHVVNRAFLVTLLSYGKHRLLEAADGAEGLKLVKAERPDLVISDILMPNMDGHEFVTRIHAIEELAATPVIFYTAGYHEAEARVMARSCGVAHVLPKPSEPEVILRTVNLALGIETPIGDVPALTAPPPEGSRFSTIDSQLAEYLVELESSSNLIAQLVENTELKETDATNATERGAAQKRLAASLTNLQAASVRLSALVEISREIAAETRTDGEADLAAMAGAADRSPSSVTAVSNLRIAAPADAGGTAVPVSRERAKFQARLAKALEFAGYPNDSPTQLAREFNFRFSGKPITIHAARKWLVGESIPTQDKLRVLAQWLGVTAEWLRFGDADQAGVAKAQPHMPAANSEEGKLLAELLELDPYHRRLAHDFISMLAAKHIQESAKEKRAAGPKPKTLPAKLG